MQFSGVDPRSTQEKAGCARAIAEIAEILAAAFMRVRAAKSSAIFADSEESSLHMSPAKSGDPVPATGSSADDR